MRDYQRYIRMTETLMGSPNLNSTEKILLAFLEVLTDKGSKSTDKSNTFFGEKLGKSVTYISTMIKRLKDEGVVIIDKEYGRRTISLNKELVKKGYISKKAEGKPKNLTN